jgi:hypothetical protein
MMANREQRRGREKKKPKAEKPKPMAQVLPFSPKQGLGMAKSNASKKGR